MSSRNNNQVSSSILTLSALAESLGRHLQGEQSATRYLQRHGVSLESKSKTKTEISQQTAQENKKPDINNSVPLFSSGTHNQIENADFSFPVLTASHKQLTDSTQESSKQDQAETSEFSGPAFQPHDDIPKQPRIYQKNPVEPISQVVARIIQAIRTRQHVGRINAAKLVANTAQQQVMNDIPLLKKGAIPKQLIIYVDRSAQTAGFDDELLGIAQQVAKSLSNTQVNIIVLPEQCRGDWYWLNAFEPSQGDIALPSAGEPALILTRLTAHSHSDWRYLLKRLAKQQSPVYWFSTLFALPTNVQSELTGSIIRWGKVSRLSEQLVQGGLLWLYALCWSCRIVTGAMVRELIQQAQLPAGAESEFWLHSPFAYVAGADIGVLRSVSQSQREQLQQQFAAMLKSGFYTSLQGHRVEKKVLKVRLAKHESERTKVLAIYNQIIEKHLAGISESVLHEQRMHVSLLANWQAPKLAESEAFFQKLGKQLEQSEQANNKPASNELTNQVASFLSDTLFQYGNTIQTASSKLKETLTLTSVYLMQHSEFDQVPGAIMEQVQRRLSGLSSNQAATEPVTIVQQHYKSRVNISAVIRNHAGNSFPIQALGELQNTANTPLLLKTRSQMHSESETEAKQFVKPVSAENIKSAPSITLPETRDVILQSQFEALAIAKRSSKDFYWAKRLSVTNHSVVAETDEFVVAWNGLAQSSEKNGSATSSFTEQLTQKYALASVVFHEQQGCFIGVKQSAPEWLQQFLPQLDEHGVFATLQIERAENQPQKPKKSQKQHQAHNSIANAIEFTLRYVPAGSFLMGSPEDEPERNDNEAQHSVKLTRSFWLGETTVTQDLWHLIMGNNPSEFKQQNNEQLPVERVSWDYCQQFCTALNQRIPGLHGSLPSEAQWEYACRAGTTSPFSIVGSDGEQITPMQANFNGHFPYEGRRKLSDAEQAQFAAELSGKGITYREKTIDVHAFPANAWGLKQMHGNVWEWCADAMRNYAKHSNIGQHASDPLGECSATTESFVRRGGGWINGARGCRSAYRLSSRRDGRRSILGLRLLSSSGAVQEQAIKEAGKASVSSGSRSEPRRILQNIKHNIRQRITKKHD